VNIRLTMDEDAMDQVLVEALRARGVDISTALDEVLSMVDCGTHVGCEQGEERANGDL
jgi:hypothetical protein